MAAESWLLQEPSDELMVLNLNHIFLLKCTTSVDCPGYSGAARVRHNSAEPPLKPSALALVFFFSLRM